MKTDKYGEPLTTAASLPPAARRTMVLIVALLAVLVVLNVLVIVLPVLNLYLCFLTAPMFLFLYIALHKAVSAGREQGVRLPGALRVLPPVFAALYLLSAVAAVFSGL